MKKYFKIRKQKKQIKELLKSAKHAQNMREDVADNDDLNKLDQAIKNLYQTTRPF